MIREGGPKEMVDKLIGKKTWEDGNPCYNAPHDKWGIVTRHI